ncbi:MAG: cyclic nucleotide-binding domain-containing protein [Rhodospirillales bacterium]|nr:cyclic nucleotide-binding domain-containing protein [Rhodospirillales bacterium]
MSEEVNSLSASTTLERPKRWDSAFDPDLVEKDFETIMSRKEITEIDASFPPSLPLDGIVRNDMRLTRLERGDIMVREGDYGNSAFILIEGKVHIATNPQISVEQLGGSSAKVQSIFSRIQGLLKKNWVPEVRMIADNKQLSQTSSERPAGTSIPNIDNVMETHEMITLGEGEVFGELAALGRTPRTATIFASTDVVAIEIRWQGLRDIMKYDTGWRKRIDKNYRETALANHLSNTEILKDLSKEAAEHVSQGALFETYGAFDWHHDFKNKKSAAAEVIIAKEGDYPDGLLLIRAGFARLAKGSDYERRTISYLGAGDTFGLNELYSAWKNPGQKDFQLSNSLTALGYVDIIRIPVEVLEEHVFPNMPEPEDLSSALDERTAADDHLMEWAVDNRFINGSQTMVIDLDRCNRCDDCVRACGNTHGGNPRFRREGDPFEKWMVANACMHCKDPVCMIGCPTGAINRDQYSGSVIINDTTCIGCATCANSCPFENINMVSIRNLEGSIITDGSGNGTPIMKATKCDLCAGRPGGPACVQACPKDALQRVDFRDFQAQARL